MPVIETSGNKFLIVIAGPTAVGKTRVAMDLAIDFDAEIFSADSRQIYREMYIGTAKPSLDELLKVKHHFIDHVSIHEFYSVGHYEREIKLKLSEYFKNQDVGVLVGGTGLYIRALMEGLDIFPDVPENVSFYFQNAFEKFGLEWLQNELLLKDPEYFSLVDQYNPRRIIRALSVIEVAGTKYSSLLSQGAATALPYHFIPVLLELPREILYDRINRRVDEMIKNGLVDEAFGLHKYRGQRSLETVGYQELFDFLENKSDLDLAVELIKQNSRRYAKRQMTWFRKYGNWTNFDPGDYFKIKEHIHSIIANLLKY